MHIGPIHIGPDASKGVEAALRAATSLAEQGDKLAALKAGDQAIASIGSVEDAVTAGNRLNELGDRFTYSISDHLGHPNFTALSADAYEKAVPFIKTVDDAVTVTRAAGDHFMITQGYDAMEQGIKVATTWKDAMTLAKGVTGTGVQPRPAWDRAGELTRSMQQASTTAKEALDHKLPDTAAKALRSALDRNLSYGW